MEFFDIEKTLKESAISYYGNDHVLAGYLLKGCLRRLTLLPLNVEQAAYLNSQINALNEMIEKCNYTALADIVYFELIQNFPDFDSLLKQSDTTSNS